MLFLLDCMYGYGLFFICIVCLNLKLYTSRCHAYGICYFFCQFKTVDENRNIKDIEDRTDWKTRGFVKYNNDLCFFVQEEKEEEA